MDRKRPSYSHKNPDKNLPWPGPVFCLLLRVSSDYAQTITWQLTEETCPVIGWAQPELARSKFRLCSANRRLGYWCNLPCDWPSTAWAYSSKRQKTGPGMISELTHWGRVTHVCVSRLTITGSDNGLSPGRRQAIIWTNAGILLIGLLGTNCSENLIEVLIFSFTKMRLKASSAKWRPFCLGLNVLRSELPVVLWSVAVKTQPANHSISSQSLSLTSQLGILPSPICWAAGGRFKNTYELLNLRALKFSPLNKIHIFQCMGKIFCVEFQRYPLKFHTKYLTHTLKGTIFIQHWNFKSS